ncbi:MAG TPA: GrpB family protein, partial [Inquilinus sp.]|nr:GrpB family protein [Inquilinus sp.]
MKRRAIEVVDYDPAWPALFEEIRAGLERLLDGLVLEIQHIGSTAVPGLCAKPKIDVDIVLRSAEVIPEAIGLMQATGDYIYHGDKHRDGMWAFTTGRG